MGIRHARQTAGSWAALLVATLVVATTAGQTQTTTFHLSGDPSELSGTTDGSTITPLIGPQGTLTVTGGGFLEFGAVGHGLGVAFRPGGRQANDAAYYGFRGSTVGTLFDARGGDVVFSLKSRYAFAQRLRVASRWAFDVYDARQRLFTFHVSTDGGALTFHYRAGGVVTHTYVVPAGREDAVFGSGVVLTVRMLWDGSRVYLYVNGALVQASAYSPVVPDWTAASSLVIGTRHDPAHGAGHDAFDDWIGQFTVTSASAGRPGVPASSATRSAGDAGTNDRPRTGSSGVTLVVPPPPPPRVVAPSPANGATGVAVGTAVSWTASPGATAYDLYLGTTLPGSPTWANMTATSYSPPGGLAATTQYFWRVDARSSSGTTIGTVWSFTTGLAPPPPPKPTTPSPANVASNVAVGTSLSWTGSPQATSYDLYIGATLPATPTASGLTATTLALGAPLAYGTTYAWRVDSRSSGGITAGDVWTFTTSPPPGASSVTVNPTADAAIHAIAPNSNLGGAPVVTMYNGSSALFAFSLPQLPGGAVLMSAKLQLSDSGYDDGYPMAPDEYCVVGLYRLTRPWTETGVTHNMATASTSWTSAGGDYDSTSDFGHGPNGLVAEALSRLSQTPESLTFDVTALVAKWYQGVHPNYGFHLRQTDRQGGPMMNFREVSNPARVPALVVTYAATTAAPAVISVTPSNGAASRPVEQPITFVLNDLVGINPGSLSLVVNGVQRASQVQITGPPRSPTLTYTPATTYGHSTSVNASLSVQNWAGYTLTSGVSFTVAPTDTVAPGLTRAFPLAGATNVPTTSTFAFRLIDRDSGVDLTTLSVRLNGTDVTGAVQILPVSGGYQLHHAPPSPLPAGQAVTYTVTSCDKAAPRNCLTKYTHTFTTLAAGTWFRGTVHQHTADYSYDADPGSTIASGANAVRAFGDKFLIFAQHQYKYASKGILWTPAELQAMAAAESALGDGGFAVIGGQEVFTNKGHTITFGVSWDKNPQTVYDLEAYADSQSGVFAFAHPDYPTCPCTPKNASDYRFFSDPVYLAAYTTAGASYTPGKDGWSSGFGFLAPGGVYDQMLTLGRKVYVLGETDYHANAPKPGGSVALLYGTLPTQAKVIDAMRTGRLYVTGSPNLTLDFTVNGYPAGSDLVDLIDDAALSVGVTAAVAGGTVDQVTVIRDNATVYAASPAASSFSTVVTASVTQGSRTYFRVVVAGRDATGQVVRAISNPIFVGAAP